MAVAQGRYRPVKPTRRYGERRIPKYYRYIPAVFFCLAVLYAEVCLSLMSKAAPFRFWTVACFSVSAGMLLYLVTSFFKSGKVNFRIGFVIMLFFAIFFIGEYMIHSTFALFLDLEFIFGNAENAAGDFADMVKSTIIAGLYAFPVFAVPLIAYGLLSRYAKIAPKKLNLKEILVTVLLIVTFWALGLWSVSSNKDGVVTDKEYYTSMFDSDHSVPRTGLVTTLRLNIKYLIFGKPEIVIDIPDPVWTPTPAGTTDPNSTPDPNVTPDPDYSPTPTPTPVLPNILDYDFADLATSDSSKTYRDMAAYFASVQPSMKNEYTGLFEGKNIIFLTLEAFSPWCVTEELMPTMYMLLNNGIVFEDYYQPAWGGSTSTGEWSNLTGLYPNGASAMKKSATLDMSYTLGNQLIALGYTSYAFHNNTYTYYSRDKTHENLGYEHWIAIGNGLEMSSGWPRSDLEMMEKTIDYYIDKQPFSVYYMTVSGHANYSWSGNNMSARHKAEVADLPYSETVKAFIACNLEVEYAMRYILQRLDEAGILDNTVIVMSPDHYPYGLVENQDKDYFNELAGHELEKNFEYYKSCLVMYCSSIEEPIVISEPTYSLDILPTLLNLFGIDFDSRLFTGRDVLSDASPLVIFPNGSFITDLGRYNASNGTWYPLEGAEVPDGYVSSMSKTVRNKIAIAKNIQEYDYFAHLKQIT